MPELDLNPVLIAFGEGSAWLYASASPPSCFINLSEGWQFSFLDDITVFPKGIY